MKRFVLWLFLATLTIAAISSPALADRDPHVQLIYSYGDAWYNYDFDDFSHFGDPAFADFPVGPIWRSYNQYHGTVDYVKGKIANLGPGYPETNGAVKYSQVSDGGASDEDDDQGRKTACYYEYGNGKKRHIRPYAPYGYQLYNSYFGYYVISNVHAPHWYGDSQCSGGADDYGWSEDYEGIMLSEAAAKGYSTYRYAWSTLNASNWREDYNHYQKSNGWASRVTL